MQSELTSATRRSYSDKSSAILVAWLLPLLAFFVLWPAVAAAGRVNPSNAPAVTERVNTPITPDNSRTGAVAVSSVDPLRESISAGGYHSCALQPDGTLICWGRNGQLQVTVPAATFYRQVSAGGYHTCGLQPGGTLDCWGWDNRGQLNVPAGSSFTQVSAGQLHTCGLLPDGAIACWGYNVDNQADAPSGTFKQTSAGGYHSCGLKTDNTLVCWGNNSFSQLIPPSAEYSQVSAGLWFTCGLKLDGSVACWGRDDHLQVSNTPAGTFTAVSAGGNHACALKADGSATCWGSTTYAQTTVPEGTFSLIDAGDYHTCGLKTDDSVACWGYNSHGQLNVPDDTYGPYDPPVQTGTVVIEMMTAPAALAGVFEFSSSIPGSNSFSLTPDTSMTLTPAVGIYTVTESAAAGFYLSHLSCDGDTSVNLDARTATITVTADATTTCTFTNSELPPPPDEIISIGGSHSCGLKPDGEISCWGSNFFGQTDVPAGPFTAVSAGSNHTCGLRPDGNISCWGRNEDGQTTVPAGTYTQVSAGGIHTCGLWTDGTVTCWGDDSSGQASAPPGTFTDVRAGSNHTCGLRIDGSITCWGARSAGALDAPEGAFVSLSVGTSVSCAVRTGGSVVCWGADFDGQTNTPAGTFVDVSVGNLHSCGLRVDRTVVCWGGDNAGQATVPPDEFVQVSATGFQHTCGLKADGSVNCWGDNLDGQAADQAGPFGPPVGRVEIVQATYPSTVTDTFDFTSAFELTPTFRLTHGETEAFVAGLGTFTVTQSAAVGFSLSDLKCDGDTSVDLETRTATITVTAAATTTCTFTNTQYIGTLQVAKLVSPIGLTDSFTFTVTDGASVTETFALTGGLTETLTLTIGSYAVTEAVIDGFELVAVDCGADARNGVTNPVTATIRKDQTTTCTFTNALIDDGDGIEPDTENAAPNGGDGNGDGVPDYLQNNVTSLPNGENGEYVSFATQVGIQLVDVTVGPTPDDLPAGVQMPIGVISFTLTGLTTGASVTVTLHLEADITADTYYKLVNGVWTAYPNAEFVDSRTIVLTLTDGGDGDLDGTANGVIVDPGGPGTVAADSEVLISTWTAGKVGDLSYGPHDVLGYDGDAAAWTRWFTGTAAGLDPLGKWKHNLNAIWISDTEQTELIFSLTQDNRTIPSVPGIVDGMDLLRWDGSALSVWFDGQDVGLNVKTQEKIDGLHVLPAAPDWSEFSGDECEAYLLLSTQGNGLVPKPGNVKPRNAMKFGGEDVVGFCATSLGPTTTGHWEMVLDGSAQGVRRNSIDSLAMNMDTTAIYVMTKGAFKVDTAFGGHSMIFAFDMDTERFSGPYLRLMDDLGIQPKVDALHVSGMLGNR